MDVSRFANIKPMKKIILISALIFFTGLNLFGQKEIAEIHFHFFPAFIAKSDFNFSFQTPTLKYEIISPYYKVVAIDSLHLLNDSSLIITTSFSDDGGWIVSRGMEMLILKEKIEQIYFPKQKKLKREYDGTSIEIQVKYLNGIVRNIYFDSPNRIEDSFEYIILDAFFDCTELLITDGQHRDYLENLKNCFDYE